MTDAKDDALTAAHMAGFEDGKAVARREQAVLIRQLVAALIECDKFFSGANDRLTRTSIEWVPKQALATAKEAGY